MSGDVQPRKRKDKKRKKDDLGLEEPRGTSATLGEGDVFMHSHHEQGTGGHWCAKIIFFSLLAVLITLIGLIILENRGLSELEANAVESRYSGVLEGWLEDAPDDDHHDEHTLELSHHDNDDDDEEHLSDDDHLEDDAEDDYDEDDDEETEHSDEAGDNDNQEDQDADNEDEADDIEDELDKNDENELDDDDEPEFYNKVNINDDDDDDDDRHSLNDENDTNQDQIEQDDEDDEYRDEDGYYEEDNENEEENIKSDEESNEIDNANDDDSIVNNEFDKGNNESQEDTNENDDDDNEDDEHDDEDDDSEDEDVEVEKLEKEEPDEDPISTELPALPEDEDNNDDIDDDRSAGDLTDEEPDQDEYDKADEKDDYLEIDDNDEPMVEHITAPPGKPLPEVEEETSSEKPPNTLAEEEEYEKRQEELRREEEQSSHMWLKLTVGGALLAATHAVMRRATQPRDLPDDEEPVTGEDTPLIDRRLTLIPEEQPIYVPVKSSKVGAPEPSFGKVVGTAALLVKPPLVKKEESDEEEKYSDEEETQETAVSTEDNKELYSDDEEEAEEDDPIVEEPKQISKHSAPAVEKQPALNPEPEEEDIEEDDVEIIEDEQLDEELVDEEDEEEISDVDDAELLTRLEAKYGKLPEPERFGPKQYKDGGNSLVDDDWPGEPSDAYWRDQLDSAEREMLQGDSSAAVERTSADPLRDSARARWIRASALDRAAEEKRDNTLLSRAITAYLHLLKMNERLSDKKLLQVTGRTLDRIQFRGNYLNAEPVYKLLIRRFPNDPAYRNNLTISFLMANRADLAEESIKETLERWPDDRLALAHYGFVLKTRHNRYEEAAEAFRKALEGDTGPANEARFYYHYGDSLLLLGRREEAHVVHKRGAALGHFLSPAQRSLYNVPRLKSSPWWRIEDTPYSNLAKSLEKSWKDILKEAQAAEASYEKEKEGLKEHGEWSQLDLFVRGREVPDRCKRAPVTCSIVKGENAAAGCRRGQIKFSLMAAGTHVRPHVGPTNCRLRMHLGLSNTKDTYIRVDQEIRQWREGRVLLFDDSFEHEVWHNGTGTRLVLIVDVWHPHLTAAERRQLPAI
ncbi:hypothetical protein evm_007028 [Chilo suppressalis]|nr:hypothetical protein evm_007028 [Chilo suppressalis]